MKCENWNWYCLEAILQRLFDPIGAQFQFFSLRPTFPQLKTVGPTKAELITCLVCFIGYFQSIPQQITTVLRTIMPVV
jgi:hypothetical protein